MFDHFSPIFFQLVMERHL